MDTNYLILMAVFVAGIGVLLLRHEPSRMLSVNCLYLLSGGLALYSVEMADADQPFHITALVALLLCLIPTTIDSLLSSDSTMGVGRIMRKNAVVNHEGD